MFQAIRGIRGNIKKDGILKLSSAKKALSLSLKHSNIHLKPKPFAITRPLISSFRYYLKEEKGCLFLKSHLFRICTQPIRNLHGRTASQKALGSGNGLLKSEKCLAEESSNGSTQRTHPILADYSSRMDYSNYTDAPDQSLDIPRVEHPIKEPLLFPPKKSKVGYGYKLEKIKADSFAKKQTDHEVKCEPPHNFHIPEKEYPDNSLASSRPLIILPGPPIKPEPKRTDAKNLHPSPFLSTLKKKEPESGPVNNLTCPSESCKANHSAKLTQLVNASPSPFLSTIKRQYSMSSANSTQNRGVRQISANPSSSKASLKTASWKPLFVMSQDKGKILNTNRHLIATDQGASILSEKKNHCLSDLLASQHDMKRLGGELNRKISSGNISKEMHFASVFSSPTPTLYKSQLEHKIEPADDNMPTNEEAIQLEPNEKGKNLNGKETGNIFSPKKAVSLHANKIKLAVLRSNIAAKFQNEVRKSSFVKNRREQLGNPLSGWNEQSNNNCRALPIKLPVESSKIKKEVDNVVESIKAELKGNSTVPCPTLFPLQKQVDSSKQNENSNKTEEVSESQSIDSGPSPYLAKIELHPEQKISPHTQSSSDKKYESIEVSRSAVPNSILITPPKSPMRVPQRKNKYLQNKRDAKQFWGTYEFYRVILNKFKDFGNKRHVKPLDIKRLPLPLMNNEMGFGPDRVNEKFIPYVFQPWERSIHESLLNIGKEKNATDAKDLEDEIFLKSPYTNEPAKKAKKEDSYLSSYFAPSKSKDEDTSMNSQPKINDEKKSEISPDMIPPAMRKPKYAYKPKTDFDYPAPLHSEWMKRNPDQVETDPLWFKRLEGHLKKLERDVRNITLGNEDQEKKPKEEIPMPTPKYQNKRQRGITPYQEMVAARDEQDKNRKEVYEENDSVKRFLYKSKQVIEATQLERKDKERAQREIENDASVKPPNPFESLLKEINNWKINAQKSDHHKKPESNQMQAVGFFLKEAEAEVKAKKKEAKQKIRKAAENDLLSMLNEKRKCEHQLDTPFKEDPKVESDSFFDINDKESEPPEISEPPEKHNLVDNNRDLFDSSETKKKTSHKTPPHFVHKSFSELLNDHVDKLKPIKLTPHNIDAGRKTREILNKQIQDSIQKLPLQMIDIKNVIKTNEKLNLFHKNTEKSQHKEIDSAPKTKPLDPIKKEANKKDKEKSRAGLSLKEPTEHPELTAVKEKEAATKKVSKPIKPYDDSLTDKSIPKLTDQKNIGGEILERIKQLTQNEGNKGSITSKTASECKALLALLQSAIKSSFLNKEKEPAKEPSEQDKIETPDLQIKHQKVTPKASKLLKVNEKTVKSRATHAEKLIKTATPIESSNANVDKETKDLDNKKSDYKDLDNIELGNKELDYKESDNKEVKDDSDDKVKLSHSKPLNQDNPPPDQNTKSKFDNFEWSSQGISKLLRDIAQKRPHLTSGKKAKDITKDTEQTNKNITPPKTKARHTPLKVVQENVSRPPLFKGNRSNHSRKEENSDRTKKNVKRTLGKAPQPKPHPYKPPYSEVTMKKLKSQINKPKFVSKLVKRDTSPNLKLPNSEVACERNWYTDRAYENKKQSVRKLRAREAYKRSRGKTSLYDHFQSRKRK